MAGLGRIDATWLALRPFAQGLHATTGHTLYMVGGSLRNQLLGLPAHDIDVCSAVRPDQVVQYCAQRGVRAFVKQAKLGCVEIRLPVQGKCWTLEHTTFRTESYPPGGAHRPCAVAFADSLEVDALRRDFTVNALYWDTLEGKLVDPLQGQRDLRTRTLRATREAKLVLQDDALRILRMVRFAYTLNFTMEEQLFQTARAYAPNLADLAPERIREEFTRILLCEMAYPQLHANAVQQVYGALACLQQLGAWAYILPDLCAGEGCIQSPVYHAYDVLQHNLHVCAQMPPKLELRLAGLLHDVAKPCVFGRQGSFVGHDVAGESMAVRALGQQGLRYPKTVGKRVGTLIRHHLLDLDGRMRPARVRQRFVEIGKEMIPLLMELRRADYVGSGMGEDPQPCLDKWAGIYADMLAKPTPWSIDDLNIDGKTLKEKYKLPSGPEVGNLKQWLWRQCVQHPQNNRREVLLDMAKKQLRSQRWSGANVSQSVLRSDCDSEKMPEIGCRDAKNIENGCLAPSKKGD